MGTYVDISSNESVVTSIGRGDHVTAIDNEDIFVNIDGYIGTAVRGETTKSIVTDIGGNATTVIDNIKESYNLGGVIDTYVDTSTVYSDVMHKDIR